MPAVNWILILASAFLVGCANQEAAVIERYKAAGLAQLKHLQGVGEMMRDRAPLDADAPSLPFERASFKKRDQPPPDGAFIDAEFLTEEGMRKDYLDVWLSVDQNPFWGRCGAWLTTGKNPDGSPPQFANVVEEELQVFLKVKYVGVARTVELRVPESAGEGQFSGGRYRFDMYFFELADPPKYLGGLRVDAYNDPKVRVEYRKRSRDADMKEWLVRNLRYRTHTALYELMTERAKGITMNPPSYYKPDE